MNSSVSNEAVDLSDIRKVCGRFKGGTSHLKNKQCELSGWMMKAPQTIYDIDSVVNGNVTPKQLTYRADGSKMYHKAGEIPFFRYLLCP